MVTAVHTAHQVSRPERTHLSLRKIIGYIAGTGVPVALWYAPLNMDPNAKHALAVSSFMIIAWITETIPHAVTGLIGCYLFWVLHVVNFNVAFGGFAEPTPWFLFGAGLFGMMATKSGLARRVAFLVLRRAG